MKMWYVPFIRGIPCIPWTVFERKYLPMIEEMMNLGCGETERSVGAHMVRAAALVVGREGRLGGRLLQSYLGLCADPVSSIQRGTLSHLSTLLKEVTAEFAEVNILPTVH